MMRDGLLASNLGHLQPKEEAKRTTCVLRPALQAGPVLSVNIPQSEHGGNKGYAFVEYADEVRARGSLALAVSGPPPPTDT